jgi:hypothetical protein
MVWVHNKIPQWLLCNNQNWARKDQRAKEPSLELRIVSLPGQGLEMRNRKFKLRAGLDQESRPIFPLQTLKSDSLISRRIEANPDEFRLGVKAITKYWYSI